MTGTSIRNYRLGLLTLAVLMLAGAATNAIIQKKAQAADAKLQELADNAALAGVTALAASEGKADGARLEAADAAARYVLASHSKITPIVAPSLDQMKMSVTLTSNATGKGPAVTATARYVEPGTALSSGQTALLLRKRTGG